jgi:hypothetical protein
LRLVSASAQVTAFSIDRYLSRINARAAPDLDVLGAIRLALTRADGEREEIEANYERSPGDLPHVEDALRSLADRLATVGDPSAPAAWLSVARATRYQPGRRDDTLSALIEAPYWGRGNDKDGAPVRLQTLPIRAGSEPELSG